MFGSQAFSFAYYLFTFFAIEAAFFIAWGHWRRSLSLVARRFAICFGVLGVVRLIFPLGLGFISAQAANQAMIPLSLGLLVWGFAPYIQKQSGIGFAFLAANTILTLIFFAIHAVVGEPAVLFSSVWLLWQTALSVLVLVSLFQEFSASQIMAVISFCLLAAAGILQLLFEPTADSQTFVRFAEMIAYPLLVIGVYQEVIASLELHSAELQNLSQSSLEQIRGLISLFEATKNITAALDLSQVLDGSARGVVQAVEVDQCAIALPEEGEPNLLRLVATYNPKREGRGEAITFPVSDQAAIKHAMDRLREVEINSGYDTPQLKFLFAMMGAREETGPLIIQPLILHNRAIGVLIVGNAYSKQAFGPTKAQLIKTMANQIAVAIDNAQAYQAVLTKSQQLAWTLRNQEQDAGRRRAAMEAELKKNREEVSLISQRLYEQETLTRKSQKELTEYQQRINQLNEQIKLAHGKLERVVQENRRLASMTESHKKQIDELTQAEEALEVLRKRLSELEIRASEAGKLEADLTAAQERSRKLAKALRLSRTKLQQLAGMPSRLTSAQANAELESLSCGVLITDGQGLISRANDASGKLLDAGSNGLVGKKLGEIVRDEIWTQAMKKIADQEENLISVNFMAGEKFIRATISPMVDSDSHEVSGNVVILYDITEEFESQQARDEFVASLSQDLRTPMTSITGYIDLLLGESVGIIGDMQRKFLQRVKANIERMDMMLRSLIGVTAIDAGQFEIKPVQLNLAEIIEDAIIGAKAQLEEKEIQPYWDIPEQLPPIEADPDCMHQVMANLLGNAAKVTPVGGTISVKATVTNGDTGGPIGDEQRWLQVSVADGGGGIAEKDLDRVFDRFYLAERPLVQGLGETGVGLSLVKYMIEAHGGKVWLDTEMGQGSTFHFKLAIPDYYDDPWQEIDVPPLDLSPDDSDI